MRFYSGPVGKYAGGVRFRPESFAPLVISADGRGPGAIYGAFPDVHYAGSVFLSGLVGGEVSLLICHSDVSRFGFCPISCAGRLPSWLGRKGGNWCLSFGQKFLLSSRPASSYCRGLRGWLAQCFEPHCEEVHPSGVKYGMADWQMQFL